MSAQVENAKQKLYLKKPIDELALKSRLPFGLAKPPSKQALLEIEKHGQPTNAAKETASFKLK